MSHFIGLVINTPKYLENHNFEDALAPYDESLDTPEYVAGEVSDYDKIQVIEQYIDPKEKVETLVNQSLYKNLLKEGKIEAYDPETERRPEERYYAYIAYQHKDEFAALYKSTAPLNFAEFERIYQENGMNWNNNAYRKNLITNVWEEISTYNPKSKWDWYVIGGRWDMCLTTKDGQQVNDALLGELNFEPYKDEDYETFEETDFWGKKYRPLKKDVPYRLNEKNTPFCLIVDGQWIEKGEMGWWGMTSNEKPETDWEGQVKEILSKLPADAEVTAVDFHI